MPNTKLFQMPKVTPQETGTKERQFYQRFKQSAPPGFVLTRVESLYAGYPDLTIITPGGVITQIELKVCTSNKVRLSPAQISYMTKAKNAPVYILVRYIPRKMKREKSWLLYKAEKKAVQLALYGLDSVEPDLCIEDKNYSKLFDYL